jgi:flavin-dependent dehydrogenase
LYTSGDTVRHRADLAIVGAGPAGARAAELVASSGASVLLLDPKVPWEKPCGGGLTAAAFRMIPELEEVKALAQPVTSVRVEAGSHVRFTVGLDQPLWVIPRAALGEWQLARALRVGAKHLPVRVTAARRVHGDWHLQTAVGDVTAPVLVGADGAASMVRRVAAPQLEVGLAPTRVTYPPSEGVEHDTAVLRFYPGVAGYLWDFPRPDHRSCGIMAPRDTWRRSRMDEEIDGYRGLRPGLRRDESERAGAVIGTAEAGHGDYAGIAGRDFALLGDAAGLADPFTGEGMLNAMRSAGLFAKAWMESGLSGFPRLARESFEREFRIARALRRWLFENGLGLKLVEDAATSGVWHGLVAAMLNGMNEHDGRISHLVRRWSRRPRPGVRVAAVGSDPRPPS